MSDLHVYEAISLCEPNRSFFVTETLNQCGKLPLDPTERLAAFQRRSHHVRSSPISDEATSHLLRQNTQGTKKPSEMYL